MFCHRRQLKKVQLWVKGCLRHCHFLPSHPIIGEEGQDKYHKDIGAEQQQCRRNLYCWQRRPAGSSSFSACFSLPLIQSNGQSKYFNGADVFTPVEVPSNSLTMMLTEVMASLQLSHLHLKKKNAYHAVEPLLITAGKIPSLWRLQSCLTMIRLSGQQMIFREIWCGK